MLNDSKNIVNQSLGFIETRSFIGAIEASDAMVKAADVRLENYFKIGGALVTVVVRGDLGSCLAAVDAGKEAAEKVGELISSNVIARPFEDTNNLVSIMLSSSKRHKNIIKKNNSADKKVEKERKLENEILIHLKKTDGMSLVQIAKVIIIEKSELRVILKGMIDKNQIEKAGTKYYIK